MKKFFSVLLAALMLFTVAGCGASEPAPAPAEPAQEAAPAEPAEPASPPKSPRLPGSRWPSLWRPPRAWSIPIRTS